MVAACQSGANNGLTLIGTGAESVAMGGADVAVARDTTALSTNPAGLSQLRGWGFDGFLAAAYALDVAHADQFGNNSIVDSRIIPIAGFGIAKPLDNTGLTFGLGLFAQAGAGNVYNHLITPFGGTDALSARFGVLKVVPGFAWQATDELATGVAVNIYYASYRQRTFPSVSAYDPAYPSRSFFGSELGNASTTRVGAKVGALYKPVSAISLGVTYSPRVNLPFDNGELKANFSALGLGSVTYRNAQLRGLALPEEVAMGIAWRPTPRWLLAVDLMWSNYSRALRTQALTAANPDNPAAPPTVTNTAALDWHNQTVIATGVAYSPDEATRVYGGVSFGRNPVPATTLSPLLAAIGELHLTTGVARQLDNHWQVSGALEYLVPTGVVYYNPQLPFGPGAQERVSYVALTVMLSRRW